MDEIQDTKQQIWRLRCERTIEYEKSIGISSKDKRSSKNSNENTTRTTEPVKKKTKPTGKDKTTKKQENFLPDAISLNHHHETFTRHPNGNFRYIGKPDKTRRLIQSHFTQKQYARQQQLKSLIPIKRRYKRHRVTLSVPDITHSQSPENTHKRQKQTHDGHHVQSTTAAQILPTAVQVSIRLPDGRTTNAFTQNVDGAKGDCLFHALQIGFSKIPELAHLTHQTIRSDLQTYLSNWQIQNEADEIKNQWTLNFAPKPMEQIVTDLGAPVTDTDSTGLPKRWGCTGLLNFISLQYNVSIYTWSNQHQILLPAGHTTLSSIRRVFLYHDQHHFQALHLHKNITTPSLTIQTLPIVHTRSNKRRHNAINEYKSAHKRLKWSTDHRENDPGP
jgi:hypothetical protein